MTQTSVVFGAFYALCITSLGWSQRFPTITTRPTDDLPRLYHTIRDWAQLPATAKTHLPNWPAAVTAVEPAPDGTVYVIYRCLENSCAGRNEDPILKYDRSGKLIKSWGGGMFVFPHGSTLDSEGNLWVTDAGGANGKGHQVIKFSPDGKLLMSLGTRGVAGAGHDTFDQPTDVAVARNGDIFVADGHRNATTGAPGNNRIVRFTKDGRYITEWGKKGTGPGELREPHSIALDSRGNVFVADRINNRIHIFDSNGGYLASWAQFGRPSAVYIHGDKIYVTDSETGPDTGAGEVKGWKKGIRVGNARDGKVTEFIEDLEPLRAEHSGAEGLGVDSDGNVYGAVVRRRMLEKHVLNPSAPFADISNGQLRTRLWLPDPAKGFYRGTRFDWSGSIANLDYKGHTFFGEWFIRYDPAVHDISWDGESNGYTAGKASANVGPVEEFTGPGNSPPGYDEAKPGETFLKIGVGVLRKPADGKDGHYDNYFPYEIADPGKWSIRKLPDRVEFTQTLGASNGYAYEYGKTVRLAAGAPDMIIEHVLKNRGSKTLESSVYDHNFLVIDHQAPGPALHVSFPFDLKADRSMAGLAEASGHEIGYLKTLSGNERAMTGITGFGNSSHDYDITVENRETGAGVRIRGDRPLERIAYWSVRSVASPEAFVHVKVEPGNEFRWSMTYHFYSVH
jgi:streptogramin lyase